MKYFFLLSILVLSFNTGFSCSCIHTAEYTLKKEYKETDLVFKGNVIKIDTVEIKASELNYSRDEIWYTFKITENFKGKKKNKTVRIRSGNIDWDDCKYEFKINESYVVYANHPLKEDFKKNKSILETTNCTNTGEAKEEKILEVKNLKKG
jgi:hypothetical protein